MLLIEFERTAGGDIAVRVLNPQGPPRILAERLFSGGLPGLTLTAPDNFTILRLYDLAPAPEEAKAS